MKQMLWNWFTVDACMFPPQPRLYDTFVDIFKMNKTLINTGFLSTSWHVTSRAMFAGSCVGVLFLVVLLEFLRRLGREYDLFIIRRARLRANCMTKPSCTCSGPSPSPPLLRYIVPEEERRPAATDETPCHCHDNASTSHTGSANPGGRPGRPNDGTTTSAAQAGHDVGCAGDNGSSTLPRYRPSLVEHLIRSLLHTFQFALAYVIMLLAMYFNGYIIICIFIGVFLGALVFSWEPLNFNEESNDALSVTKCCG
ncbi:hypothetical protein N7535_007029 [Penicillium sp. DV-2018c]|nr:hypothetical protein N7535_007029 [Penicillium sp. DV-2018c]